MPREYYVYPNGTSIAVAGNNEYATQIPMSANDATDVYTAINAKADSSSLATVATSGSYTDLSNRPIISPVFRYGGTTTTTKIKISINSELSWMLCFTVTLYQGYRATKVMISGYNYGTHYWYQPEARLIGDSDNTETISVYFGYDSVNHLWLGFDGSSYTGVSITDVVNGYTQIDDWTGLFTISNVSSLATLQSTVTAASRANYANDSAKLGGLSPSSSATANTVVTRQANGYVYATYYNASNGAENISSYTSYVVFKDSNGWMRMTSLANFKTWFGKANSASSADSATSATSATTATYGKLTSAGTTTNYNAANFTVPAAAYEIVIACKYTSVSKLFCTSLPKAVLTANNQQLWVSGGRGNSLGSANSDSARCLCNVKISGTTFTLQGVSCTNEGTPSESCTWYVYYR